MMWANRNLITDMWLAVKIKPTNYLLLPTTSIYLLSEDHIGLLFFYISNLHCIDTDSDLSRVYPTARPMTAGIGSSTPRDPLRISGIEDDWLTDWLILTVK